MAVATRVASPEEKPSVVARKRPFWRATTMSWSELILTRISSSTLVNLSCVAFELLIQIGQTFFEIQSSGNVFEPEAQLHHGKGNFRLDSHNHRFRAAQANHVCQVAQRTGGE